MTYFFSRYFSKIKVGSYNSTPVRKRLTLHNVIIDVKYVLNKDKITTTIKLFKKNTRIN